jgi:hypothetical protein
VDQTCVDPPVRLARGDSRARARCGRGLLGSVVL